MKKRYIILLIIALIILLYPKRKIYEDGGTRTYTALAYKVIMWKEIEGKTGTEIHFFLNNFHPLDYYDH